MTLRAKSFTFIWNADETWPHDQDLENDMNRFLLARGLEATVIKSLSLDPLILMIKSLKQTPVLGIGDKIIQNSAATMRKALKEQWIPAKMHTEDNK